MADPWADFITGPAQPSGGQGADQWADFSPSAAPQSKAYKGNFLPLSVDEQGGFHFDSDAGVLGTIKRAITLPGDVYNGKVAPGGEEAISRSLDLAGVASPVNPAARIAGPAFGALSSKMVKADIPVPSAEALRDASKSGYEAVKGMGVDYSSDAVRNMASTLRRHLEEDGILEELAPKSFSVLKKLETPPEGSVLPFGGLEAARRAFGQAGKDFANPTDQLASRRAVEGIDGFMASNDPGAVVAGPAAAASKTIADARGNYAAAARSDKLTGLEDAAELRAAAANSGQNIDNAIRSRAASVVLSKRDSAGFSSDELAAIREVANGTAARNTLRFVGNLLGGGGGLGAIASGGVAGSAAGAVGGVVPGAIAGAAVPLVGLLAKKTASALTSKSLNAADEMVRQRSPLFQGLLANTPLEPASPFARQAPLRGLLSVRGN